MTDLRTMGDLRRWLRAHGARAKLRREGGEWYAKLWRSRVSLVQDMHGRRHDQVVRFAKSPVAALRAAVAAWPGP